MSKEQRTIPVGVIGVGSMGQHHARVMASLPGVRFVGVADADLRQARTIANLYGVQPFEDCGDLLEMVDAVSVAAPTAIHYTIGMDCFQHGIHVMMEKPLASDVTQAMELAEASRKAGVVLQVGHIERFNPTFTELAKVLGREHLLALEARRLSPFVERAADVSAVLDLMVHDIDLVLKLANSSVAEIQALGIRAKARCMDHVSAHLLFDDGVVANLTASKISQQKVREITAICEGCVVQADLLARTVSIHRQATAALVTDKERVMYRQEELIEQVYVPPVEPLYAEIYHFVQCVRTGQQPLVAAEDAIRVLELAEAIEKAADTTAAAREKTRGHQERANP